MSNLHSTGALHRMVRYDAKSHILDCIGDLNTLGDIPILGNNMLVAPYVPSGLMWNERCGFPLTDVLSERDLLRLYEGEEGQPRPFLNQQLAKESIFQGKVMLVLCVGTKPEVPEIKPGDWVWTLQENTRQVSISLPSSRKSRVLEKLGIDIASGWICKIVYDKDIYGVLPDPDCLV
jgi:hypothetical protein